MFNKIILIGRLGQNAEAKTTQNNREYVILNIATQESWKNEKGEYETRTEWHRVYAWSILSKFAKKCGLNCFTQNVYGTRPAQVPSLGNLTRAQGAPHGSTCTILKFGVVPFSTRRSIRY